VSDPYTGEIRVFLGSYVPEGWLACDGSAVKISQYPALYSAIADTYGATGDQTTFKLPDLRGRAPLGSGMQAMSEVMYPLGGAGGAEAVVLTQGQMPAHTHDIVIQDRVDKTGGPEIQIRGCGAVASRSSEVQPTGAGRPVPTMPPFVSVPFIICWGGTFPQG
jgi:microcystin-dependent protein